MATTITPTSLTVTINESYNLNEVEYGNNITKTFAVSGEVSQRIMNVSKDGFVTIFNYSTADLAGTGVATDYVYFRITNLDDTNFISLEVYNGTDTFWIKVKAGESFVMMDNEIDAIDSSTTFGAFADITRISAQAATANVDIEFIAATT
jgi:hypothetical protein